MTSMRRLLLYSTLSPSIGQLNKLEGTQGTETKNDKDNKVIHLWEWIKWANTESASDSHEKAIMDNMSYRLNICKRKEILFIG